MENEKDHIESCVKLVVENLHIVRKAVNNRFGPYKQLAALYNLLRDDKTKIILSFRYSGRHRKL